MEPNSFRETVEIVKGAKAALGENLKIMISSWSPPGRLKSNGKTVGGTLAKIDGKYVYSDFAQWWYDSVAAYAKAGVKADYISIQNEPEYEAKWDSCKFSPTEDSNLAGYDADACPRNVWFKQYQELYRQLRRLIPRLWLRTPSLRLQRLRRSPRQVSSRNGKAQIEVRQQATIPDRVPARTEDVDRRDEHGDFDA